jgi:hypothetical protein
VELVRKLRGHVSPKGPFQIVGEVGRGGFGAVYLGHDSRGNLVAVKVHRPPSSLDEDDATTLQRFRREITFLKQFAHPAVPELVLASDPQQSGEPWYATRYIPGPSLHTLVEAYGLLPPQAVLHLAVQLGEVLSAVHEVGAHRDLKPGNVLLTPDRAHLVDFGLAVVRGGQQVTSSDRVLASWEYAAPERVRLGSPADLAPSDVFTLGGTLMFAATRRPPYPGATPLTRQVEELPVRPTGIPARMAELIGSCLDPDPGRRPTADDVVTTARKMIATPCFATALGPALATELGRAAEEVLTRWQAVRPPHGTAPQMPVHGNGPGWSASVGDWVQSLVAVPGRVVVVTVGGEVVTLAETDGEVVGRYHLRSRPTGTVAAFEDRVYIGDADCGVYVAGPGRPVRILVSGRVQGCVATTTGVVVATPDRLYGIDDRSTSLAWETPAGATSGPGALACSGSTVYLGTMDGAVLRRDVADGSGLGPPSRVGHRIVAIAAHRFGAHVAAADGKVYGLWEQDEHVEPIAHPGWVQTCRADGDTVVTCTADGLIRLQDLAAGAQPVEVASLGRIRRSLAVAHGLVVTGRVDGALHVLRRPGGQTRLWRVGDGIALDAPAAVTPNETVVAGWADGTVAAFPRAI